MGRAEEKEIQEDGGTGRKKTSASTHRSVRWSLYPLSRASPAACMAPSTLDEARLRSVFHVYDSTVPQITNEGAANHQRCRRNRQRRYRKSPTKIPQITNKTYLIICHLYYF